MSAASQGAGGGKAQGRRSGMFFQSQDRGKRVGAGERHTRELHAASHRKLRICNECGKGGSRDELFFPTCFTTAEPTLPVAPATTMVLFLTFSTSCATVIVCITTWRGARDTRPVWLCLVEAAATSEPTRGQIPSWVPPRPELEPIADDTGEGVRNASEEGRMQLITMARTTEGEDAVRMHPILYPMVSPLYSTKKM
jgi:hypothetical protein